MYSIIRICSIDRFPFIVVVERLPRHENINKNFTHEKCSRLSLLWLLSRKALHFLWMRSKASFFMCQWLGSEQACLQSWNAYHLTPCIKTNNLTNEGGKAFKHAMPSFDDKRASILCPICLECCSFLLLPLTDYCCEREKERFNLNIVQSLSRNPRF